MAEKASINGNEILEFSPYWAEQKEQIISDIRRVLGAIDEMEAERMINTIKSGDLWQIECQK